MIKEKVMKNFKELYKEEFKVDKFHGVIEERDIEDLVDETLAEAQKIQDEKVKKLKEEIERGVKRNKVFPLDWCFDSIDEVFALQDDDGGEE